MTWPALDQSSLCEAVDYADGTGMSQPDDLTQTLLGPRWRKVEQRDQNSSRRRVEALGVERVPQSIRNAYGARPKQIAQAVVSRA